MKVMIINPPRVEGVPVVRTERFEHRDVGAIYPPINCLYLAAILEKEGHEVNFIEANAFDLTLGWIRSEIKRIKPDIVYARTSFDTQEEDIKVLEIASEHGAVTLLRCKIIAEVPEIRDALLEKPFIDIFINGEPESIVPPLLKKISDREAWKAIPGISFRKGEKIITTPLAFTLTSPDDIPFPAYHLLPNIMPYHTGIMMRPPFTTVISSRGCPFSCTFCSYGKAKYRTRSPENVVAELEWLVAEYGIKRFIFFDEMIFLHDGRIDEICKLMLEKGLKLRWTLNSRVKPLNLETLKLMKKAGCFEICFGIESGSDEILKNIEKGITTDDIREAARMCKEARLDIYAMMLIGSPGETEETINESIKLIKEIDPFYAQFSFVVPAPNAPGFDYYKKNNLLLTENWNDYCPIEEKPIIRTEALSPEDLIRLRRKCYKETQLNMGHFLRKVRKIDWSLTDWGENMKILKIIWKRVSSILKNRMVR